MPNELVPHRRWGGVLVAYVVAGLGAGAVAYGVESRFGWLGPYLPLAVFSAAAAYWYPRLWTAWLGAAVLGVEFVVGLVGLGMLVEGPSSFAWPIVLLVGLATVAPIVAAGCGAVGTLVVLACRSFRRVALDGPDRCPWCGYSLRGLPVRICPECGTSAPAITPSESEPPVS